MRGIGRLIVLVLIAAGVFYLVKIGDFNPDEAVQKVEQKLKTKETEMESKTTPDHFTSNINLEGDLYSRIGESTDALQKKLGKPVRKDKSSYGYDWWVYTNKENQYMQFGVEDGHVVTIFATGDDLSIDPVSIGQTYEEAAAHFEFAKEVSISEGVTSYRFQLTEDELAVRPLVKLDKQTYMQLYFDTFTEKLSSVRVVTKDILLKQRPYEIYYRGKLPEKPELTDTEWEEVQKGMEQQIFDITNVIRKRHDKGALNWDDPIAEVAFSHSKDMSDNNYFSHYSQNGEGLKERLSEHDIYYLSAGENIAAQYTDGPAAVEGWLNSEGHREALLKEGYTHLGVGVYRYYYTQNFMQKP
ncbi:MULTISPECIES: CAP domain-containing protein [Sediminibacillus]|uniref:CAP domain-containing protein n=1 Tax=Sediminibacillus TaxID=482460 RepID=UPI000409452F|nr:CAP domain-containing protein [Sediminibacillus terrae]